MEEKQYFTLVFEGDIRAFEGNPLTAETVFGVPVAVGVGNAFDEIERLHEAEEAAWERGKEAGASPYDGSWP